MAKGADNHPRVSARRTANMPATKTAGAATPARPAPHPKRARSRIDEIDGLRACAIIAVVLYHMRPSVLAGGFVGVTVFFVITGFLATSSFEREYARTGSFSYLGYLGKRITRLLPAVLAVILISAIAFYLASPSLLPKIQADAVPSALFFSNWSYIFRKVSYFAAAGLPSPLTHLWYLGVVMQFYILWPLVLMLVHRLCRTRKAATFALGAIALASAILMAVLYDPAVDTARVYYGLDTRLCELALGGVGFYVLNQIKADVGRGRKPASILEPIRCAGLACSLLLLLLLVFADGESWLMYRGGYLLCAVACATLLISIQLPQGMAKRLARGGAQTREQVDARKGATDAGPTTREGARVDAPKDARIPWLAAASSGLAGITRVLRSRPLRYLGSRSFSIYLVHYPALLLMNPATRTTDLAWWEPIVQIAIVLAASEVFHRAVEAPSNRLSSLIAKNVPTPRPLSASMRAGGAVVGILALATLAFGTLPIDWDAIADARAVALRPELAESARGDNGPQADDEGGRSEDGSESNGTSDSARESDTGKNSSESDGKSDTSRPEGPVAEKVPANLPWKQWTYDASAGTCDADVLVIGDSVTAGAESSIQEVLPNAVIDGQVSRQLAAGPDVYRSHASAGDAGEAVIVALGANSLIRDEGQVQAIIDAVDGAPLYFVTVRSPYPLQDANNEILRRYASQNDNVGIIDWCGASEGHPEYLVDDGTHLTQQGCEVFAGLMRQALCGQ